MTSSDSTKGKVELVTKVQDGHFHLKRTTNETDIEMALWYPCDSQQNYSQIFSEIPVLNSLLSLFCGQAGMQMALNAKGDLEIDDHHTVEDIGICLGLLTKEFILVNNEPYEHPYACAIANRRSATVKARLTLTRVPEQKDLIDFGRCRKLENLTTQNIGHFWECWSRNAGCSINLERVRARAAVGYHRHLAEAVFMATGAAFRALYLQTQLEK